MYLARATRPAMSFAMSKLNWLLLIREMIIGVRLSELCTTWLVQWLRNSLFQVSCNTRGIQ
jgi:hypothetical protein